MPTKITTMLQMLQLFKSLRNKGVYEEKIINILHKRHNL